VDRAAVLDPDAPWVRRTEEGWLLTVRVQPGATWSGVVGAYGDALRVRVAAPANDGKANAALVRFIATHLGVPPRAVEIVAGHHNRTKVVAVTPDG
jgi:uncharacterized protein (TIGR00251 family)